MKINSITKYKFNDKEYNSLKEIKDEVENIIGVEVLDKIQRTCPLAKHADYLKLLNLLCSPDIRKVLNTYLNITFEQEIEELKDDRSFYDTPTETVNVLDITLK
jgi:hypothetical protein